MKSLYDEWIDKHIGTWSAYRTAHGRLGTRVMDLFTTDVYSRASWVLIVITFVTCFLYYFYFNKRFGSYYSRSKYCLFGLINIILVAAFTSLFAFLVVNSFPIPTGSMIFWLGLINTIYALFGFFILSVICQVVSIICRKFLAVDFSPMGNRTPF